MGPKPKVPVPDKTTTSNKPAKQKTPKKTPGVPTRRSNRLLGLAPSKPEADIVVAPERSRRAYRPAKSSSVPKPKPAPKRRQSKTISAPRSNRQQPAADIRPVAQISTTAQDTVDISETPHVAEISRSRDISEFIHSELVQHLAQRSSHNQPNDLQDLIEDDSDESSEPEGYLSYDPQQLDLLQLALDHPERTRRIIMVNKDLAGQLETNRNVNIIPQGSPDPYMDILTSLKPGCPIVENGAAHKQDQEAIKERWENDITKCVPGNEAMFQRTLMIKMIDRHRLFYHAGLEEKCFDFSTEQTWMYYPWMPTRAVRDDKPRACPKPKPDLCVSFLHARIIARKDMQEFPQALKELICFEGTARPRAFPFLIIEAKTTYNDPDDEKALHQCLNSASQALHMLYEFVRETKDESHRDKKTLYEQRYFDTVRVFTAVATSKGIRIRVHRAVEVEPESPHKTKITTRSSSVETPVSRDDDSPRTIPLHESIMTQPSKPRPEDQYSRIEESYPLRFEHTLLKKFDADSFDRAGIIEAFEKIIWNYGLKLKDLLTEVAVEVGDKFRKDRETKGGLRKRRSEEYYRHNQERIKESPSGKSQAPSQQPSQQPSQRQSRGSSEAPIPRQSGRVEQHGTSVLQSNTADGETRGNPLLLTDSMASTGSLNGRVRRLQTGSAESQPEDDRPSSPKRLRGSESSVRRTSSVVEGSEAALARAFNF